MRQYAKCIANIRDVELKSSNFTWVIVYRVQSWIRSQLSWPTPATCTFSNYNTYYRSTCIYSVYRRMHMYSLTYWYSCISKHSINITQPDAYIHNHILLITGCYTERWVKEAIYLISWGGTLIWGGYLKMEAISYHWLIIRSRHVSFFI